LQASALDTFLQAHPGEKFFLILNYPNNPTGTTYCEKEQKALSAVARKHDLIIISDEIYAEFDFRGQHKSLSEYYPEGTITCNGLSKWCGAGGWRLGYMIFPPALDALKKAVIQAGSETYSCASAPIQYAAIEAFSGHPSIEKYTGTARIILEYVANYIHTSLDHSKIKMQKPQGGFYGFLHFDRQYFGDKTSVDLCHRVLSETGVALLPGSAFGRDPKELTARMAFVDFDGDLVYNDDIITNSALRTLYLEIPKIREAVKCLNNLNSIN
jgi:aspartate/methionine/tyrosine aminotransferase